MSTIRFAIAGVGNCASSPRAGPRVLRRRRPRRRGPRPHARRARRLPHPDIEVVAAFDVDATKVGLDVGKAILAGQNNTIKFADVPDLGVHVLRGPTLDGFGKYYRADVRGVAGRAGRRRRRRCATRGADVLVSYLPVGSEEAQKYYAQACIDAGVAFVNAIPVFIASDPVWAAEVHRRRRADRG